MTEKYPKAAVSPRASAESGPCCSRLLVCSHFVPSAVWALSLGTLHLWKRLSQPQSHREYEQQLHMRSLPRDLHGDPSCA